MKNRSLTGIIILMSVVMFLVGMTPALAVWSPTSGEPIVACGQDGPEDCNFNTFIKTAGNVIDALLWFSTLIAAVVFAIAGFKYLTAGGSPGQINEAHRMFKMVAIGFVFALSAWLIVKFIETSLLNSSVVPSLLR